MPMIGANVPASLTDQTPESVAANAVYEIMVAAELSRHAWSFSTKEGALTYQGESGSLPAYVYTMPPDVLKPRVVQKSGMRWRKYELRGNKILCGLKEADDLTVIYNWRSPESEWDPMFVQGIQMLLAAHLATGLLDRHAQGSDLRNEGRYLIRQAKRNDRNSYQGAEANPDPSLIAAWKGTLGQRSAQGLAATDVGPDA